MMSDVVDRTEASNSRGRVLMLVHNGVRGDSRVQKQARSAAEHGWNVQLLGRSLDGKPESWAVGDVDVRLIGVPMFMGRRRYEFRRALLREPFAYPAGRLVGHRKQQVKAWRAELVMRRAIIQTRSASGDLSLLQARVHRIRLLPSRAGAKVFGRWVEFRRQRTRALQRKRLTMASPIDRFTTAFWQTTMGVRAWRKLDPNIWDYELAFGKVIDKMKPDIIHANDFRMLAIGARAALRARAKGRDVKLVWDAHEFLPGMRPWNAHPRWHTAQRMLEKEFAPYADAVITVSETLADMLIEEHVLTDRPAVVLNSPYAVAPEANGPLPTIREVTGLGEDDKLVVYSGGVAPQRGLDVMIEGLPQLDGVHAAFIVPEPDGPAVAGLKERAEELGVNDRVHFLPYVAFDQVAPFLSTADAGVIPILHYPNHEIALITKFFEYSHARLPIVVSDVKTMSEKVRETGQGEVFVAEDLEDFVRAVKAVLADPDRYRAAYDKPGLLAGWTWESQADILDEVYGKLKPRPSN